MKKIFFLFYIQLLYNNLIFSQSNIENLVPNCGFENYTSCPTDLTQIEKAFPWNSLQFYSSDFIHTCSLSDPNNTLGFIINYNNLSCKNSNGCANIILRSSDSDCYREYIQTKLNKKLTYGKQYLIKFYTKLANYHAVDGIGLFLSNIELNQNLLGSTIVLNAQITNQIGNILKDKQKWYRISGIYTSNGNEEFIIIGNFLPVGQTLSYTVPGHPLPEVGNAHYLIDDVSVYVCDDFKPKLGRDTTLCTGQQLLLKANVPKEADSVNYTWQDGSKDSVFLVTQPGTYWVSAYIEDYKITLTDTINVNYEDCNKPIWIPNSFTPNGDGLNDIFLPVTEAELENYTMLIYNRWGQQIFESHNINKGWDGKYKGKLVELGVYTYRIEATIKATKERKIFNGKVTMVCN